MRESEREGDNECTSTTKIRFIPPHQATPTFMISCVAMELTTACMGQSSLWTDSEHFLLPAVSRKLQTHVIDAWL